MSLGVESSMTDCQTFTDAFTYIADWLTKQPSVNEESLTDKFLLNAALMVGKSNWRLMPPQRAWKC